MERGRELLLTADYNFLRTNKRLKDNVVLLAYGGSYAYGTNVEGSDVDIRGCALNSKSDLIGFSSFEQFVDNKTDTVIYSFNKIVSLLLNCNPNVIEILGCKPEHYFVLTDIGKLLLDNKKLFLSQKAAASFGGYANQQLRRLQNALARDLYPQAEKENHICGSCVSAMRSFGDKYADIPEGAIKLSVDKSNKKDLNSEIFADVHLTHYPLRDLKGIVSDFSCIIKDYENLNARNKKKDAAHINKHAMHLVRLYLMCLDILEREEIVTYREKDKDFLLNIRKGAYMQEDGTFMPEFFEIINDLETRLKYAKKNTSLPPSPDMKKIEEMVMVVNEEVIGK